MLHTYIVDVMTESTQITDGELDIIVFVVHGVEIMVGVHAMWLHRPPLAQEDISSLLAKLKGYGASLRGEWSLSVDFLSNTYNKDKKMYKVKNSAVKDKVFVVFGEQVLAADKGIETIMSTFSKYSIRLMMSVSGEEYDFGDFIIRFGRITSGTQLKLATLVDVGILR